MICPGESGGQICCPQGQQCAPGGGCEPATAIELISFTAEAAADGTVTLAWETATELDNAGFNLYRARVRGGSHVKINAALIPAQGDAVSGASYRFVDAPGYGNFSYMLEDLDDFGVSTLHGPVEVRVRPAWFPDWLRR